MNNNGPFSPINQKIIEMPFFQYRNSGNNKDIQDMIIKSKTRN